MVIRSAIRLSLIVGEAALIAVVGWVVLMLPIVLLGPRPEVKSVREEIFAALAVFLPIGAASGWMFGKLRAVYSRREALAVSTAFAVFTPVSLVVSIVLAEISGGFVEMLAGPHFALVGVFVSLVIVTGFLSILVCSLVLRVTNLIISVEQSD
jgi:hypothetical protein